MQWLYLSFLLVAIGFFILIDHKWKLAFWLDKKRAAVTIICGVVVFSLWDMLGIALTIFNGENNTYKLPFRLFPQFPIEELFFLFLLCYMTLIVYNGIHKRWPRI